jgi:hypothetical protein
VRRIALHALLKDLAAAAFLGPRLAEPWAALGLVLLVASDALLLLDRQRAAK